MSDIYVIYEFGGGYEDYWKRSRFCVRTEEQAISKIKELKAKLDKLKEATLLLERKCSNCPISKYMLEEECKYNAVLSGDVPEDVCRELVRDYCSEFKYMSESEGEPNCSLYDNRVYGCDPYGDMVCGYDYEKAEMI